MGKNLIQQARGKGGPTYRAPSFRYAGEAKLHTPVAELLRGRIVDLIKCPGHAAPLAKIKYADGVVCLIAAPEFVKVGDEVQVGPGSEVSPGNILALKDIPEGVPIYNIELQPGDGGRFCRTSGTFARIVSKTDKQAIVKFPSKKQRAFNLNCRACIGVVAGSGRTEKPFLKAGKMHHARRAKNKRYPMISGAAQNAVDHPFGNTRSSRKAKQRAASRFAPPGRKVGSLWPKKTGKRK